MASIDLEKRVKQVGISLEKRGIMKAPIMTVGVAFDVSGSTQSMFHDGTIQETFDRLLAVSLKFDDNGELDVWTFDTSYNRLRTATADDEGTFIEEEIMNNRSISKWGGTNYEPALSDAVHFYIGDKPPIQEQAVGFFKKLFGFGKPSPSVAQEADEKFPAMLLFITDGEGGDNDATHALLSAVEDSSVYIQMVGVGNLRSFGNLKNYASSYKNVGFVSLTSLDISDQDLFDSLITQKFADWNNSRSK